jgi:hypothetical protein
LCPTALKLDAVADDPSLTAPSRESTSSADKKEVTIQDGEHMPETVTIPISFFEVTFDYVHPDLRLLGDRASIVQGIFEALQPWSPIMDNIEVKTAGKISEQGVSFKLPLKRVTFFFGPAHCTFSRDGVDWITAEETIRILETFVSCFITLSGVQLAARKTTIGLHIQPKTAPFIKILSPFVAPQLAALEAVPLKTMAAVVRWENRRVTLDGSGSLANGLFLKLEREFASTMAYSEMAEQLMRDEQELFAVLGIEEDVA